MTIGANRPNQRTGNSVIACDGALVFSRETAALDLSHLLIRKFRGRVLQPATVSSVLQTICLIFRDKIPAQICRHIVLDAPIVMAALTSFRTRANECLCHKRMDKMNTLLAFERRKIHLDVSTATFACFAKARLTGLATNRRLTSQRANAPKIGDLVKSLIPDDCLPDFTHLRPRPRFFGTRSARLQRCRSPAP